MQAPEFRIGLDRVHGARGPENRRGPPATRRYEMTLGTVLLIVLILLLIGAIPTWPYSRGWGYAPSGVLTALLVVLIVLLLMGRI
jgi:Protein of unknown function (DUF3309)